MAKATSLIPLFKSKRDTRPHQTVEVAYPAPEQWERFENGEKKVYVLAKTVSGQWGYVPMDEQ